MIPARPPCSWAVQAHKQAEAPAVLKGFGASYPRQIPFSFKNRANQIGDRDHFDRSFLLIPMEDTLSLYAETPKAHP
jgi:hypothetical protein